MPKNHPGFHRRRDSRIGNEERARAERSYRTALVQMVSSAAKALGAAVDSMSTADAIDYATQPAVHRH